MDFSRLRLGELIAGASGALLLIVMFLDWFGGSIDTPVGSVDLDIGVNAWQSFSFIDMLLFLAAIAAIGAAIITATQRSVALPVAASVIVTALGILATLLVLYRLLDPPGGLGREFGVFLGLLTSAGIALGGYMAMKDEGTSFSDAANQVQGGGNRPGGGGSAPQPTTPAAPPAAPPPAAPPAGGGQAPPPSSPPPSSPPPGGGTPPPAG